MKSKARGVRVFNEEAHNSNDCILLVSFDDLKVLVEAMDAVVKANPKKKSWQRLLEQLELAAIY